MSCEVASGSSGLQGGLLESDLSLQKISALKKSENPSPQGQQELRAVQAFVRRENPQAGFVLFAGAPVFPLGFQGGMRS